MNRFILITFASFTLLFSGCDTDPRPENIETKDIELEVFKEPAKKPNPFVEAAESAHKVPEFMEKQNVKFDIVLIFGGSERLNGTITMATNSTGIKIEKKSGSMLIYDGENAFISPDTMDTGGVRFAIFTWPYFFGLPYKLNDQGTVWNEFKGVKTLAGKEYDAMKLTFEDGTGDSPDDWYVVYTDKQDNLIRYAAYIVTLGQSVQEAEEDPHAIEYLDYTKVEGIPVAQKWKFWAWNSESGLKKELGEANISNISFVEVTADFYEKPENGKLIK